MIEPSAPGAANRDRRPWADDVDHPYLAAAFVVLVAFAVRSALDPLLGERSPFLLFTAAIVIAAGRYGTAAGLIAVVLSLLLGTFVFMAQGFPPALSATELTTLAVFIVTSAAMLSFSRHLTRAREREQQLQAALQQRQLESAMGTMAATLAHELNQPLAAATNYVGAGRRIAAGLEGRMKPRLTEALEEAEGQIHRAGEVIRQARNLVANVSSGRERTSLRDMIGNVIKPLTASGTCGEVTLDMHFEKGAEELFVNAIQIEQVLLNLMRNACQAAPPGETVRIAINSRVRGAFSIVEIRDFGSGISDERMATLFSPSASPSTSPGAGGLGLGLPISRTIIEAHGGKLWVENHREGGASFFFTAPVQPEAR